jgi:hypothetical protein
MENMVVAHKNGMPDTYANVIELVEQLHYKLATLVKHDIQYFVFWYREFHGH